MKRKLLTFFTSLLFILSIMGFTACSDSPVSFKLNFVVDGEIIKTIDTNGQEAISMPQNPSVEGYTFDGWFWDNGTWQRPFTANSLLNEPLTSDMSVYAKFTKNHTHNYSEQDIQPTCTEKGYTLHICSCGDSYKDTYVNALNHDFNNYVSNNDAKCMQDGTKTSKCSRCEERDTITDVGSKLGHNYDTPTYVWNGQNCTATRVCLNDETHIETETVKGVYIKDTDVTCLTCEKGHYKATFTNSAFSEQSTAKDSVDNGSPLNHSFTNYISNNDATCDSDGTKTAKCDRCEETDKITDVGSKKPHTYSTEWTTNDTHHWHTATCEHTNEIKDKATHTASTWIVDDIATYESKGSKHKECTVCKKVLETAEIPQLIKDEIRFKTLSVDGTNVYGKIPNSQDEFVFLEEIEKSGNATYKVSKNKAGSEIIESKTAEPIVGDNTYYILVYVNNELDKKYTVTIRRRPIYTVTFNTNGGSEVASQQIEEDSFATEPTTTRTGYTFVSWDYDFDLPIAENKTITASWTANTDTAYKVEYYLQNLEDDNFTIDNTLTDNLTGITDTTANAEIKIIQHFTPTAESVSGNIEANGSLVLKVYYTRNKYAVAINCNNEKAGTFTNLSGIYKYEKEIVLTATTNAGYTFNGWFNGEDLLSAELELTIKVSGEITITVKWTANTDTLYKVEYYFENLNDDNFTINNNLTEDLTGTTDTTVTITPKDIEHFTFTDNNSKLSGNINGDGTLILKLYYMRNMYSLSNANTSYGSITNSGTYKYGTEQKQAIVSNIYLGCEFIGWFNGENLLSSEKTYTFAIDKDMVAKFKSIDNLLENFYFSATTTTCQITGIKDKTVTEIIVPDYVTEISSGAFSGCSKLESITLPFVGAKAGVTSSDTYQYPFGYIFGTSSYTGGTKTYQYFYGSSTSKITDDYYYIPTSLKSVTVTGGNILYSAFFNCSSLESIEIPDSVISISDEAFYNCSSLTSITIGNNVESIGDGAFCGCSKLTKVNYTGTIDQWVQISFDYYYGNPLFLSCVKNLYINDKLVTEAVITTATKINDYAFYGCCSLESVTMGNSVESIGYHAFYGCSSLSSIEIPNGVTSIGDDAFYGCYSLQYNEYDNGLYLGNIYNQYFVLVKAKLKDITSCIIHNDCRFIYDYAFDNCSSLTSIEIPNGVTSIGDSAFHACSSLSSIEIPNGVTSIGDSAFSGCSKLSNVSIGDSVETIGYSAFNGCSSLTSIVVPNSVKYIGQGSFRGCISLNKITLPFVGQSVNSKDKEIQVFGYIFGMQVVSSGTYLQNLTLQYNTPGAKYYYEIPNSLREVIITNTKSISSMAFRNCGNLMSIILPSSITVIDDYAFSGCSSLTEITLPQNVTIIGSYAFYHCFSLEINIPKKTEKIGTKAFAKCKKVIFEDETNWYRIDDRWDNAGDKWKLCINGVETYPWDLKFIYDDDIGYYWYKL